tara:strand:- start:178 stop:291 length:114 start_codon:yes stop_codon:yes gene_type:complete
MKRRSEEGDEKEERGGDGEHGSAAKIDAWNLRYMNAC